jgi:hypothetical protein
MRCQNEAESDWACEEFGHADLPDDRLRQRLVRMGAAAAARPGGKVLDVFRTSAERQGAYDFLSNDRVRGDGVLAAIAKAAALRAREHAFVFVAVDGTSLTLTDRLRAKGFGAVGTSANRGCGLKVINGYVVSPQGVPVGLCAQQWWARPRRKRRQDHQKRGLADKETRHWVEAIDASVKVLGCDAPDTRLWFQLDREGDGGHVLAALAESGQWFTVRSSHNRRLKSDGERRYLADALESSPPLATYELAVPAAASRTARTARMVLRVTRETLSMRDKRTNKVVELPVTVVHTREEGTVPPGQKAIEWRLLTNRPVANEADAKLVIFGYSQRWRIEEFHRTWKTGACNVEQCQLRATSHVVKWATLMASVAVRIERLKLLARTEPDVPASRELNEYEIRAVIMMKRKHKKRTETIPDTMPTIAQATLWLAELGGYTGKSSGGPPGSITIRRGLDFIAPVAITLEVLEKEGKLR